MKIEIPTIPLISICTGSGLNQKYTDPCLGQETLRLHAGDKREVVYSEVQLEEGITHDPLWNAAQVGCLW